MSVGCLRAATRVVRPLDWSERGLAPYRWWEVASAQGQLRARVIWLREAGKIAWSIYEGERRLALGYVEIEGVPGEVEIEQAKRSAAQRWWELHA